jgi:hypothetical protein
VFFSFFLPLKMEKEKLLCGCFFPDGIMGKEENKMCIHEIYEKDLSENHGTSYSINTIDRLVLSEVMKKHSFNEK